ncbi:cysteine dioxygenase type 1-like [Ostrea edulis]|uniref:cysteine dioxygenase type 1-like n=1 Tax=Ostrea edulis TaxID=37623 RepID=UPI0024AF725A|nr:cysteine dioxygenase type 1-like [Ostrea edulis]
MNLADLKENIRCEFVMKEKMKRFLNNYTGREWVEKTKWNNDRYTRILLDKEDGIYELMILCWKPDQKSPIHDHYGSQCIMKILQGEVFEDLYIKPNDNGEQMTQIGERKTYITDQMIHITDGVGVHRVGNSSKVHAVTLHLYYPPIVKCGVYDVNNGTRTVATPEFD